MLALTGTTGKLGSAVLSALLQHSLVPVSHLILCTTSSPTDPRYADLKAQGASVRHVDYSDAASLTRAFTGATKLFLVSSPAVALDYHDPPVGQGRERHHFTAIDAAVQAGVRHVYYTSLAFGSPSKATVMRAHLRTEEYLTEQSGLTFTALREGLYSRSWPLYFGYYDDLKEDRRDEVVVAGDGPISWTAIADLGLATALILVDPSSQYEGKTPYLSAPGTTTLSQLAALLSEITGREVKLRVVSREEYVEHYVKAGRERAAVEWWVSTYDALKDGECDIRDDTLRQLLASKGATPVPFEETVRKMLA